VLYKEHVEQLAHYVSRRTAVSEVQDVIAETFLVAWRRFDELPGDPIPWLFVTARNVMANRHRSDKRRRRLGDRLTSEFVDPVQPASRTDLSEIDQRLVAAIARLPEAEREAFMLVAWDGLDAQRGSRAAGCNTATFRMRLHRARQKLKQEITPPRPFVQLADVNPSLEETR
jgi:RNA polymerase sigma-70 factor (ECF subfamily)